MTKRLATVAATVLCLGTTLAACGGGGSDSGGDKDAPEDVVASVEKVDSLADEVPKDIAADGAIMIATDPNYPPFEYYDKDNKTPIGLDIDMGNAVAAVLGLEADFEPVAFDGIIAGIAANKYEAAMSFLGDIKERQKTVDFVDYLQDTTSLMVPKGNPEELSLSTLCGHKIAIQKGSTQDTKILPELSKQCEQDGDEPIQGKSYPSQDNANLAVTSGRADGSILVTSVVGRVVKGSNGRLERVPGEGIYPKKYGVVVPKGSKLAPVLQKAFQELNEQGVYLEILKKWDQTAGAIDDYTINDPKAQ